MEINLMALNIGNSRLAIGVFSAGELNYVRRIRLSQSDDWAGQLADAWATIKTRTRPEIAGASVNPAFTERIEHIVHQVTGQNVQWVGRDLDVPINVKTENPKETGIDRVLNVAAAYEQIGKACIVVDAGTAITVDCCNDQGDFVGGAIAPGVSLMLESLHDKTARLPRIEFQTPQGAIGKSTESAIRQGIFRSLRGLVRELAEEYATELGAWPEIIATGGDAEALFAGWEIIHAVSPDLTLYGIAMAYVNHHLSNNP